VGVFFFIILKLDPQIQTTAINISLNMAATYDPSVISFIPSLEEARTATKSDNFQTFLSLFENIAKVQKQNDRYGVTLVHRHTEVEASHRNFDFKQTLQPFPLSDDAQDLYGAEIRPKSYALREMSWKPYEFEIGAYDDSANEFFAAVGQLLQQYQLADYIGLRRYSPDDPEELEITERKGISVKVPWNSVVSPNLSFFPMVFLTISRLLMAK